MFANLERRIKLSLLFIIFIWILLTCTTVYFTIRKSIYTNFIKLSLQHVTQVNQNVQLYMKLIEETSKLVSENEDVISCFNDINFNNKIIPALDRVAASNVNILGITVYGENGIVYMSSNVYQVPEFNSIKLINRTFENLTKPTHSFWLVRQENIAEFHNSDHNRSESVFTYFVNIMDEDNKFLGYILVDTNIMSVYNFYKSNSDAFYNNSNTYILTKDNKILISPHNKKKTLPDFDKISMDKAFKDGYLLSERKSEILTYSHIPNSNDSIIISIPLDINNHLSNFTTTLLLLILLFSGTALFTTKILSISIIHPLNGLYKKMQKPI